MTTTTKYEPLNDPAFRMHPITWNAKYGRNSYGDGIAQCLIATRIEGHPLAGEYANLLLEVCYERIRRADKWITT